MRKIFIGAYLIILASVILMVLNFSNLDYDNLTFLEFSGIISNILLIIAMLLTIRSIKKQKK